MFHVFTQLSYCFSFDSVCMTNEVDKSLIINKCRIELNEISGSSCNDIVYGCLLGCAMKSGRTNSFSNRMC